MGVSLKGGPYAQIGKVMGPNLIVAQDGFLRRERKLRRQPNGCQTESKYVRRAKQRLDVRVAKWEETSKALAHEDHKPGSLKHH